jgi:hypothetical protein
MAVERRLRRAQPLLTESLELRREIGDTWGIAAALNNLARAIEGINDDARAETFMQKPDCSGLAKQYPTRRQAWGWCWHGAISSARQLFDQA